MTMSRTLLLISGIWLGLAGMVRAADLFAVDGPHRLAGGGIGEGGPALAASLLPLAVEVDGEGRLLIADETHNLVRAVGAEGLIERAIGSGRYGFNGDGIEALAADLQVPVNLAIGAEGEVYFIDLGNRRVRKVERDGRLRTLLDEEQIGEAGAERRFAPEDLAIGWEGELYVADRGNEAVWRLNDGGEVERFAGTGERGFDGDEEREAIGARLADPRAVAVAGDGSVYIADAGNRRVRRVRPDGLIETAVGRGGALHWEGRILPWHASLKPVGLAFDGEGRLLIADGLEPRLLRLELHPMVSEIARFAEGVEVRDVAVEGLGSYLVAAGLRVWRVRETGEVEAVAGNGAIRGSGDGGEARNASLYGPVGVVMDGAGDLYVADRSNHRIRRLGRNGGIETVAGTGEQGYDGDGGEALAASFNQPTGLALDADGDLYIADELNHRVRRLGRNGAIETMAGTGEAGYGGDGGEARLARLQRPTGLAFDARGNLFVADAGNGVIRRISPGGLIETVAGNGGDEPVGGGGPALESALVHPVDVQVDERGRLIIVDAGAHLVYRMSADGILRELAGTGVRGRGADGSRAREAELDGPLGALADGAGGVYVADSGNGRLLHVDPAGVMRVLSADMGQPVRLAGRDGQIVFTDGERNLVSGLRVEREWRAPEERVVGPEGYAVETVVALPESGLLEVVYERGPGRLFVTRDGWVERIEPEGVRRTFAETGRSRFSSLPVEEGLFVGTPTFLGYGKPLELLMGYEERPLAARVELYLEGVDGLAWSDGLLIHQESGRLLRLMEGDVEEFARLPAGGGLVVDDGEGAVYFLPKSGGELLRLEDEDGDGLATGLGEVERVGRIEEEVVGMAFGERLYIATPGRILRLEDGGELAPFASGFAPALLDIAAGEAGELYALEGDGQGGRLLRLAAPSPVVRVWPASLDFGALPLGQSGQRTVVMRNEGARAVEIELEEGTAAATGGAVRLEPGEARRVEIGVLADRAGQVEGMLSWREVGGGKLAELPFGLEGLAPGLELAVEEMVFGAVPVGGRADQRLSVTNGGRARLIIERLSVEGGFGLEAQTPLVVEPGAQADIGVSLEAAERRDYAGALRIYNNDPERPVAEVRLIGVGGQAELGELPEAIDLGQILVGHPGQQGMELRNLGEVDLLVRQVRTGDERVVATPRQVVVPPGETRRLSLQLRPDRYGRVEGELAFVSNDPTKEEVRIPFSGLGLSSLLQVGAEEHWFGKVPLGARAAWTLPLRNYSRRSIAIEKVEVNSNQFGVVSAPRSLPAGGEGSVLLEYRPTLAGGVGGQLTVRTDLEEAALLQVGLSGWGQVDTRLSLGASGSGQGAGQVEVPVRIEGAENLVGVVLVMRLSPGVGYGGITYPAGSLLAGRQVLVVDRGNEEGGLEIGISMRGEGEEEEGIDGSGLLGVLQLDAGRGGEVRLDRAILRLASGVVDTVGVDASVGLAIPGDLNGDGLAGMDDVFLMVDQLGKSPTEELERYDLNADGAIDRGDLDLLLNMLQAVKQ